MAHLMIPKPSRIVSREHLDWIIIGCCLRLIRHDCSGPIDPHHVKHRASGGGDDCAVPLCRKHHQELHAIGRKTFAKRYGVDLAAVAAELWKRTPHRSEQ